MTAELVLNIELHLEISGPQNLQELSARIDDGLREIFPNTDQILITLPTWQFEEEEND